MRLLLTNDDGYGAAGLQALRKALSGEHEVWVVAPDSNRSAVSHCITLSEPVRLRRTDERGFSCSGFPVDCVLHGLAVMGAPPDAVVSGINMGANLGTDILFSGTCAAARQASLKGIPALALSIKSGDGTWRYDALARFVRDNIGSLLSLAEPDVFVNVNALSAGSYRGWRLTGLSRLTYGDKVRRLDAPDGHSYSFLRSGDITADGDEESDYAAVRDGFVSISRVHAQPVSADYMVGDGFKLLL